MEKIYKDHPQCVEDAKGDDLQIDYYRTCALRCYLFFLVDTSMFVEESATYVDLVYLQYIIDLTMIHEYNWGGVFGLHVLEVRRRLSLEDKADDREMHTAYSNLLLLIFS